jgi:hypothetical protein
MCLNYVTCRETSDNVANAVATHTHPPPPPRSVCKQQRSLLKYRLRYKHCAIPAFVDNNFLLDVCDEELFTTSGGPIFPFLFFLGGGGGVRVLPLLILAGLLFIYCVLCRGSRGGAFCIVGRLRAGRPRNRLIAGRGEKLIFFFPNLPDRLWNVHSS